MYKKAYMLVWFFLATIGVGFFFLFWTTSIKWNPRWFFTKYRNLRPYVIAQAMHETGRFTSDLYKTQNNAFGMRCPVIRPDKNAGCKNDYSVYRNAGKSLADLFEWFDYTLFPEVVDDSSQYVNALLVRGYFTDSPDNYLSGINKYLV